MVYEESRLIQSDVILTTYRNTHGPEMTYQKIVLKYTNPDQWEIDHGSLYVGMSYKTNSLLAMPFQTVELAKQHSRYTSEPTEVKILTITVEEQDV